MLSVVIVNLFLMYRSFPATATQPFTLPDLKSSFYLLVDKIHKTDLETCWLRVMHVILFVLTIESF